MANERIDDILKEYEEGLKRSMICASSIEIQKQLSDTVKELKYSADIPTSPEEAIEKLRFNQYDLIVLDADFGGKGLEGNEFLRHLQNLPMSTRRYIFVALYGEGFKTMDNLTAFQHSVNVVINKGDLANAKLILKKTITENEQFYKVFKESLAKFGKV